MSLLTLVLSLSLCPLAWSFTGNLHAHDPSFIRSGHCYYIFSTSEGEAFHHGNIPIRRLCKDDSVEFGALFENKPQWLKNFTKVEPNMWAPDVNYFNDQYYVYYVGSSMGSRNSAIGVATAKNIEGPYTDHGEVIHTTNALQYNAIDPEIAWTIENGKRTQLWLVFGSYWTGIHARRLDMKTGKASTEDTKLYSLASRNGAAIEASSVAWRNGYYYLFVSFDRCCSGVQSTYRVMVGRSRQITGPYVDHNGVDMMKGGGTQILASHGHMIGPGGEDVILDNGVYRMIYHYYDGNDQGRPKFDIVDLVWSKDDWPSVGPQSKLNYN